MTPAEGDPRPPPPPCLQCAHVLGFGGKFVEGGLLCGEAIMDLLSGPEVLAADYVIKSIIISLRFPQRPRFIPLSSCVVERNGLARAHTHARTRTDLSVAAVSQRNTFTSPSSCQLANG